MRDQYLESTVFRKLSVRPIVLAGLALLVGLSASGCKGTGGGRPTEEQGKAEVLTRIGVYDRVGAIQCCPRQSGEGCFGQGFPSKGPSLRLILTRFGLPPPCADYLAVFRVAFS